MCDSEENEVVISNTIQLLKYLSAKIYDLKSNENLKDEEICTLEEKLSDFASKFEDSHQKLLESQHNINFLLNELHNLNLKPKTADSDMENSTKQMTELIELNNSLQSQINEYKLKEADQMAKFEKMCVESQEEKLLTEFYRKEAAEFKEIQEKKDKQNSDKDLELNLLRDLLKSQANDSEQRESTLILQHESELTNLSNHIIELNCKLDYIASIKINMNSQGSQTGIEHKKYIF